MPLVNFDRLFEYPKLDGDTAVYCNPGSFGSVPKTIRDEKAKYDELLDRSADLWMRRTSVEKWFENRQAIAPFLNTDARNLAFVTNTTAAVNAVLSSIDWQEGDVILVTNQTFLAVRHACDDVPRRHRGVEVFAVMIKYPLESDQEVVDAFTTTTDSLLQQGKRPRLAIVDAISSMPALRYPFEKIARALSERQVEVFLDAAQTPGQIDIDLSNVQVDYFAGNLHKWFFCPKGTAVIYVAPKHQETIRAPIVAFDNCRMLPAVYTDPMSGRFYWQGTYQNTSFACVTKAIEFIDQLGGLEAVREHNAKLADEAVELVLQKVPGSGRFQIPSEMVAPYLRNFLGPASLKTRKPSHPDKTLWFYDEENVWSGVGALASGDIYFRLSCQISNTLSDYEKLAEAVNRFSTKP